MIQSIPKNIRFLILLLFINSTYAQVSDFKNIDFIIAENTAKLYQGRSLDNLALLAHDLTNKLPTDIEKFRSIYTWVCNNIKGDSKQDNVVSAKIRAFKNDSIAYLKWNNKYKKIAFKKLLKHKKTMCTGYAYLIKELCFLANIECEIINGYGRTTETNTNALELTNHSWNAVKLNNKWYLCDATWSSGYLSDETRFIKDYNDGYFLTDPILFVTNHYPLDKKWLLDETLINTEFVASPLVYSEAFKHKILPMTPSKMDVTIKKNAEVNFSFKALKGASTATVSLVQFSGFKERPFKIYDLKTEDDLIQFKYQFKFKGSYDVHLKINDDIVATYVINVKS